MTISNNNIKALYMPFAPNDHEIREGHFTNNGEGVVWLTYIRRNAIQKRLDQLFPGEWSNEVVGTHHYEDGTITVTMSLTINGITRTSNGSDKPQATKETDKPDDYENAEKGAMTDAFKRVASMWGIGLYLQDSPFIWTKADYKDGKRIDYDKKREREQEAMNKVAAWLKDLMPVENPEEVESKRRIALLGEIHRNINTLIGADVQTSEIKRLAGLDEWSLDDIKKHHPEHSSTEKFAKLVADRWAYEQPKAKPTNGNGNHTEDVSEAAEDTDPKASPTPNSTTQTENTQNVLSNKNSTTENGNTKPVSNGNGGARIGGTKPDFAPSAEMKMTPDLPQDTICVRSYETSEKIIDGKPKPYLKLAGNVCAPNTDGDETYGEVARVTLWSLVDFEDIELQEFAGGVELGEIGKGKFPQPLYVVATRNGLKHGADSFDYVPGTLSLSRAIAEAAASRDEGVPF